jgi:hypothetical protein
MGLVAEMHARLEKLAHVERRQFGDAHSNVLFRFDRRGRLIPAFAGTPERHL